MKRTKINLIDTGRLSPGGDRIYSTDGGLGEFITQGLDTVETESGPITQKILVWCSVDGEPFCHVDANKYDIQDGES